MPSASTTPTGQPIDIKPHTSSVSPNSSAGDDNPQSASNGPSAPSSTTTPPLPPPPPPGPPGQHCCESGRPVLTDPITGQTVCSCQYDNHILNYQRLAASGGLPLGMYNPAAASAYGAPDGAFLPGLGPEQLQSAFYTPGVSVSLCFVLSFSVCSKIVKRA